MGNVLRASFNSKTDQFVARENILETALDNAMDGVLVLDKDLNFVYANLSAVKLLGCSKEITDFKEWMSLLKVFYPDKVTLMPVSEMPAFRVQAGKEVVDYIIFVTTPSAPEGVFLSVNGKPIFEGQSVIGSILNFRDVTDHYLHEALISQQREFFKNILDIIPAAIFVRNLEGTYTFTNKTFDEFFAGLNSGDKEQRLKASQTLVRVNDEEVLRKGGPVAFEETFLDPKGKGERHFKVVRFPIKDYRDNKTYIGGISFDETLKEQQKKMLENERLKSISAAKLAAIGSLAGEIGHEINNPLSIIKSTTFLLKEMAKDRVLSDEVLIEKLDGIEATLERVTGIIRSLKNISRQSFDENKHVCHIREILDDVLSICELKFKKHKVSLQTDVNERLLNSKFSCYRLQLTEVLLNLLGNALDAVEQQTNPKVGLSVTSDRQSIQMIVTDNGPGVPEEIQDKIFEPFFTTKELGKGTGLGLSISKNIIESHGGELRLQSQEGLTQFVVRLPWSSSPI